MHMLIKFSCPPNFAIDNKILIWTSYSCKSASKPAFYSKVLGGLDSSFVLNESNPVPISLNELAYIDRLSRGPESFRGEATSERKTRILKIVIQNLVRGLSQSLPHSRLAVNRNTF